MIKKSGILLPLALLWCGLTATHPTPSFAQAVPVKVERQADGKWQILRDGKPYFIKGAGGGGKLELLKAAGGNSLRGWGAENAARDLDEARKHGLTLTLGIWLGHPEHGFKYDDPKQVAEQQATAEAVARKHKDHPALLAWGIGNEMEMATGGKDDNVWRAVENIARAIKKIDPNHPTMTVIAEIGEDGIKAKKVRELCPSIDILGVNSYGGVSSLPQRLKAAGWTKPYVVTEFGPPGPWEVAKTDWGAALEPDSTAKAEIYRKNYEAGVASQPGWCVGSYVFLWGDKVEATPTWFGMFLPGTGEKLGPVDAMAQAWGGKAPSAPAPRIAEFASSVSGKEVAPGSAQTVTLKVEGAGGLTYRYEIRAEAEGPSRPEPGQQAQDAVSGLFPATSPAGTQSFTAPARPGQYRLYAYVRDGKGGGATANVPFVVKAPAVAGTGGKKVALPAVLLGKPGGGGEAAFVPSGWMGNRDAVRMDERSTVRPRSGATCLKAAYTAKDGWAGVVWQYPADDWGDRPESLDLSGAKRLTFWARGEEGGEVVGFQFGILGADKKHPDSAAGRLEGVTLTREWKQYALELAGKDLSRIKTGFAWTVAANGKPTTFYLDDIRFE